MSANGDPMPQQQYSALADDLEKQELDSPGGIATSEIYGQLLSIYLLQNDLTNAKFLWKRIPASVKEENTELEKIWNVGRKLWNRDIPGVYQALAEEWSDPIKPILTAIRERTRTRALQLVSKAYSSINSEDVAIFVGMSPEECAEVATNLGWEVDATCKIMKPKRTDNKAEEPTPSEEQLAKLTEFVSFLEN